MRLFVTVLAATFGVALASCDAALSKENWRYFGSITSNHAIGKRLVETFQRIDIATKGELKIRYIAYGETPFKNRDAPSVIRGGQAEMSEFFPFFDTGAVPEFAAPDLLLLSEKLPSPENLLEGSRKAWKSPAISRALDDFLNKHGARALGSWNYEVVNIFTAGSAASLNDLKNLKVRSPSPEFGVFIEALGSVPIDLPFSEVYQALQRKTVNALVASMSSVISSRWSEVVKNGYIFNLNTPISFVIVNKDALDRLPPNLREVLVIEMDRFSKEATEATLQISADALATFAQLGIKMTTATQEEYAKVRSYTLSKILPDLNRRIGANGATVVEEVLAAYNSK